MGIKSIKITNQSNPERDPANITSYKIQDFNICKILFGLQGPYADHFEPLSAGTQGSISHDIFG